MAMTNSKLKKIIKSSTYDRAKKEFTIQFKEKALAELIQMLMGPQARRGNFTGDTVRVYAKDIKDVDAMLNLLELTIEVK